MANLNLGATPNATGPTIHVRLGRSSAANPLTDVAARVWAKNHQTTSHDLTTLRLYAWNDVMAKLLKLNPKMLFRSWGDGRVVIGVDKPSAKAISDYERHGYYARKEIDACKETPGPRVWIVAASENSIDYDTDLLSAGRSSRVMCRSLVSIITACVNENAFTFEAAQRMFGVPFRGVHVKRRYLKMTPSQFHARQDGLISVGG